MKFKDLCKMIVIPISAAALLAGCSVNGRVGVGGSCTFHNTNVSCGQNSSGHYKNNHKDNRNNNRVIVNNVNYNNNNKHYNNNNVNYNNNKHYNKNYNNGYNNNCYRNYSGKIICNK
ncbi:MAG: hypothetical protein R3Y52_01270 [Psittacicella sp.]